MSDIPTEVRAAMETLVDVFNLALAARARDAGLSDADEECELADFLALCQPLVDFLIDRGYYTTDYGNVRPTLTVVGGTDEHGE